MSAKLERLLNLTAALLETPRPLTVDEIHRRVVGYSESPEAFRRTFERDKDDLREMGIPLEVVPVPGSDPPQVGYTVPPDEYYLRDPGLTSDELAALQLAVSTIGAPADAVAPLRKLGGLGAAGGESSPPPAVDVPTSPELAVLFEACTERRVVRFHYAGTAREVHPYRLDFTRGRWYLTAHVPAVGEERSFRLDRVESSVELTGQPGAFERPPHPPGVRLDPWRFGDGDPVVASLLVDAGHVGPARNLVGPGGEWEDRPDGSAVLTLAVTNRDAFRTFVLGFLDHAEVLGPPDLRAEIVGWLQHLAERGPWRN